MPALVDTCGWIEWLTDGELADQFAPHLMRPEEVVVPTAIQFELYKWVKRERDEVTALEIIALTEQCHIVSLDTATALLAADLSLAHRLSFADALIYATAQRHGATLTTSDDHFEDLPGVEFYRKD
ncbi:type II toxin-antitoxin system VapC family toxin [Thioalkalivibrio sulfidiphilus]|uniref:type II toxin-antitoxin system VapC family toxin n=1 Tax=Thioalkalivibrio sulfidiphilus TaxID=1033854 RepID=UPI00036753E9|nr:type II toxin-antitoxin system VapC family toxin [Thioalkalivibrio sulfidiphilus]